MAVFGPLTYVCDDLDEKCCAVAVREMHRLMDVPTFHPQQSAMWPIQALHHLGTWQRWLIE